MKRRVTAADLHRRLDALGEAAGAPLSPAEAAELARLTAEHEREFRGPITSWALDRVEAFIRSESDPASRRLDELRRRNVGPEQTAADHRRLGELLGIDPAEVPNEIARAIRELQEYRGP